MGKTKTITVLTKDGNSQNNIVLNPDGIKGDLVTHVRVQMPDFFAFLPKKEGTIL